MSMDNDAEQPGPDHADDPRAFAVSGDSTRDEAVEFLVLLDASSLGSTQAREDRAAGLQARPVWVRDRLLIEAELAAAVRFAHRGDTQAALLAYRSALNTLSDDTTRPSNTAEPSERAELAADALDVLQDVLQWRMTQPRWSAVTRRVHALADALRSGDLTEMRAAVFDLELSGPTGWSSVGDIPAVEPSAPMHAEIGQLVHILSNQEGALRKMELVGEAEELANSTNWGPAAARYRDMMTEWKAVGRVDKDVDDTLWHRFRSAQDVFFTRRSEAFADHVSDQRRLDYVQRGRDETRPDSAAACPGGRPKVVWVEDPAWPNRYEQGLFARRFDVETATSTAEAARLVRTAGFAAVVSGPEDLELLDAVRASGGDVPCFVYSSERYPGFGENARRRGARGVTNALDELLRMVLAVVPDDPGQEPSGSAP